MSLLRTLAARPIIGPTLAALVLPLIGLLLVALTLPIVTPSLHPLDQAPPAAA